jgi:hypothetical protein
MNSGGQIDGQVSSQSPVVLWYCEVSCEVVGMCVEAVPVLGAESVDFPFNWCDLKILSEDRIRHVPRCIGYHAQDFPLEHVQMKWNEILGDTQKNSIWIPLGFLLCNAKPAVYEREERFTKKSVGVKSVFIFNVPDSASQPFGAIVQECNIFRF